MREVDVERARWTDGRRQAGTAGIKKAFMLHDV